MCRQLSKLMVDIENCRQEMVQLASKTSFSNHLVIETSRKLDGLLNRYSVLTAEIKE